MSDDEVTLRDNPGAVRITDLSTRLLERNAELLALLRELDEYDLEHDWSCKTTHSRTEKMIDEITFYECNCGTADFEARVRKALEET